MAGQPDTPNQLNIEISEEVSEGILFSYKLEIPNILYRKSIT